MAIGSIVHEMFQTVISHRLHTTAEVTQLCDDLVTSQSMVATLYEIQMSVADIRKQLQEFIPKIVRFVGQYITGDVQQVQNEIFH